jgi:hypothetical protein
MSRAWFAGVGDRCRDAAPLAAICALAAGLRLYRLGYQSLSFDEACTWLRAERPWHEYVAAAGGAETAAPLYLVLMRLWVHLGQSEFMLRLPSALLGVLGVPLVYRLGSVLVSKRVGLVAAFLIAVSPFHLAYSREARPYPLVVVLTLISAVVFVEIWKANGMRRWPLYSVASALAAYAQYLAVLAVISHGVAALFNSGGASGGRRFLRRWLVAAAAAAVMLSPWLRVFLSTAAAHLGRGVIHIPRVGMLLVPHALFQFSVGLSQIELHQPSDLVRHIGLILPLAALFGGLFVAGLVALRRHPPALAFALATIAVPAIILLVIHQVVSLFMPRYIIFCLPIYLIVLAAGVVSLPRPGQAAALVALASLSGGFSWPQFTNPDFRAPWRRIATDLQRRTRAGDLISIHMNYEAVPLRYYYRGPCRVVELPSDPARGREPPPDALAPVLGHRGRVWLVLAYDRGTGAAYERMLSRRFTLLGRWAYGARREFRVRAYAARQAPDGARLRRATRAVAGEP